MKVAKSANMNTCEVPQMICEEESGQHLSGETFCLSHLFTIIKGHHSSPNTPSSNSNSFQQFLGLVGVGIWRCRCFSCRYWHRLDKIMLTWKKGEPFLLYFLIVGDRDWSVHMCSKSARELRISEWLIRLQEDSWWRNCVKKNVKWRAMRNECLILEC